MSSRPVISESFFAPKTVAVIGATKKFGFGFGVPKYLIDHGYKDRIYLINPRQTELFGLPVYPAITDVPGEVDLAIIVIPAPAIPEAVRGCLKKGVRSIIIESAGFSETGEAGRQLEQDIHDMVKHTDTRIIGPNCVGVMNPHNGFATTEISFDNLTPGNIAVVAQSGVFGNILIDWAPTQNNVTVVTSSGSMGAMTTDACVSLGLKLPPYPADAVEKIKADAPGWMNVRNPLDVGPSGLFGAAVAAAIETDEMHNIILIPVIPDLVLKSMADTDMNMDMSAWFGDIKNMRQQASTNKPMIIMTLGSADWMQRIMDFFGRDVPVITTPDNAARALYELYRFSQRTQEI